MLIKSGADVNKSGDNGITPLFLTAQAVHNKAANVLAAGLLNGSRLVTGVSPLLTLM